jgi:hypothetical protein
MSIQWPIKQIQQNGRIVSRDRGNAVLELMNPWINFNCFQVFSSIFSHFQVAEPFTERLAKDNLGECDTKT